MRLTRTVQIVLDAALCLAYPQPCALCRASVESRLLGVACKQCWSKARIFNPTQTICWKCGRPSTASLHLPPIDLRCRECDPQYFTAARACGVYEGALRQSVLDLKRRPHLPGLLTNLLVEKGRESPLDCCTRIVPVPLHPMRERARGFNQASIIAKALSKLLRLPFDDVSLVRTGHFEKYRAGLDSKGRAETVAGVFEVPHPKLVVGEHILLVDDVFTTGATASSCAESLLAAGASGVFVLTIARPGH